MRQCSHRPHRSQPTRPARSGPVALLAGCLALTALPAAAQSATLEFSATQRTRLEAYDGSFRANVQGGTAAGFLRTTLRADLGDRWWGAVVELQDSRQLGAASETPLNGGIVNTLEPLQAYLELRIPAAGADAEGAASSGPALQLGRISFNLGSRRVVARNRYRNTANFFTGGRMVWSGIGSRDTRIQLFHLAPMETRPEARDDLLDNRVRLDRTAPGTTFSGFHGETSLARARLHLFLYHLDEDAREGRGEGRLTTVGGRLVRAPAPAQWDGDVEVILQRGVRNPAPELPAGPDVDRRTFLYHLEAGYTFQGSSRVRLAAQFDHASGDGRPDDDVDARFDRLFGARRFDFGPTGIFGPFVPENLISPGIRLTWNQGGAQWMMATRHYWMDAAAGRWGPASAQDPTGTSGTELGHLTEVRYRRPVLGDALRLEAGAAWYVRGGAAAGLVPDMPGNIRYFYLQTQLTL